jgi:DNA (cytosine-5)-methyltransferase 1
VRTVREALAGLPITPDGNNDHCPRQHGSLALERFAHVPSGGTRRDLPRRLQSPCWRCSPGGAWNSFGRLVWDSPADTLRTVFLKPETGRFIHPSEHRGLTVREGARLQSFPDSFQFAGSRDQRARQIGNSVPPLVARAVGVELLRLVRQVRAAEATAAAKGKLAG